MEFRRNKPGKKSIWRPQRIQIEHLRKWLNSIDSIRKAGILPLPVASPATVEPKHGTVAAIAGTPPPRIEHPAKIAA